MSFDGLIVANYSEVVNMLRETRASLYDQVLLADNLGTVVLVAEKIADLTSSIGSILPDAS